MPTTRELLIEYFALDEYNRRLFREDNKENKRFISLVELESKLVEGVRNVLLNDAN